MTRLPAALLLLPLLLAGCTGTPDPQPAPVTAEPAVEETVTPPPSATADPIEPEPARLTGDDIPTDCRELVDPVTLDSTFGNTPLNHPAVVGEEIPASGDVEPFVHTEANDVVTIQDQGRELLCVWEDPADRASYIVVQVSVVAPEVSTGILDEAEFDMLWACASVYEGRRCTMRGSTEPTPPVPSFTYFVRDEVFVEVVQLRFPTDDLIGSIVETLSRS